MTEAMTEREFFDKISDIFGRRNWADFTAEECAALSDLFTEIEQCFYFEYNRGYDAAIEADEDDNWE